MGSMLAAPQCGLAINCRDFTQRCALAEHTHQLFFTSPWEEFARRRGDALGLRLAAERFSDILAPGLSNATVDARWITLISWCLKWSHQAWTTSGGGNLADREAQQQRYAWLRPLELLWVARSVTRHPELGGQLLGKRSVQRWLKADTAPERFSMSEDQFRRYRQVGMYGAYRTLFRSIPNLTIGDSRGDGWTPGPAVNALANYLDENLPRSTRITGARFETGTHWLRWVGQEEQWWIKKGWINWAAGPSQTPLPTPTDSAKPLPPDERKLLRPLLFADTHRRTIVAEILAKESVASNHAELCDALASARALQKLSDYEDLRYLPVFTRLADAGMKVMRMIWVTLWSSQLPEGPLLRDLSNEPQVKAALRELVGAAKRWNTGGAARPWSSNITALAEAVTGNHSIEATTHAVIRHHEVCGGGLRWFRLHQNRIEPLLPEKELAASDYRFRLWPLARLAAQCGIADMGVALTAAGGTTEEEDEL